MKVDVKQKIEIYEVNDKKTPAGSSLKLEINSHWNRSQLVVLKFNNQSIAVSARNLRDAIANATNIGL